MIRAIPAFEDNYIWVIEETNDTPRQGTSVAVVDPGDPAPVIADLTDRNLNLAAILITHHHGDHTGGIQALVQYAQRQNPGRPLPVYGPANESIAGVNARLSHGDVVEIDALNCRLSVMETPGHTAGHISYFGFCGDTQPVLFCGDTLFAAGCGRLFEGTPEQMWQSLRSLAALAPETRVYCTHEYTLANLKFAAHVMPHDAAIQSRLAAVVAQRAQGQITLPSNIETERLTNVFVKCASAKEFASLRKQKDNFRG